MTFQIDLVGQTLDVELGKGELGGMKASTSVGDDRSTDGRRCKREHDVSQSRKKGVSLEEDKLVMSVTRAESQSNDGWSFGDDGYEDSFWREARGGRWLVLERKGKAS